MTHRRRGLGVFVAVQLLHLVGASLVAADALARLLPGLPGAARPLAAMVLVLPGVVLTGVGVARGAATAASWVRRCLGAWLLAGAALAAWGAVAGGLPGAPLLALAVLGAARWLARSRHDQSMVDGARTRGLNPPAPPSP